MSSTKGVGPQHGTEASRAKVVLSTSCVYPESTSSAFEVARRLGYDAVEVMVGIDPVAADIDAVRKLQDYHQVEVASIHAPCLLVTQTVWGRDPWEKLERSAVAARTLGADTVVVHPPFRWQREYGRTFEQGIQRLNDATGIMFAVENMYPWRGGGAELKAYSPGWDPSDFSYEHLTLDFSHASTARQQSLDLAKAWGDRLAHVHVTDGLGSLKDEHLLPGEGDQQADKVLNHLATINFAGHVVLEANTRRAKSRHEREQMLAGSLEFIRQHLRAEPVGAGSGSDSAGLTGRS